MVDTESLVETLQEKARECRRQARRFDAAVAALLEPRETTGRPANPNRELLDAVKRSGLTYMQIGERVGVSYRYVSWVCRGRIERPELEQRIREVLAAHAECQT
jgi:hypothetical protein